VNGWGVGAVVDGVLLPNYVATGVLIAGAKKVIVEDNVVDVAWANPVDARRCGSVEFFNNRTPSGALIQGYNQPAAVKFNELTTDVEDAFLLSI